MDFDEMKKEYEKLDIDQEENVPVDELFKYTLPAWQRNMDEPEPSMEYAIYSGVTYEDLLVST